MKYTIQEFAQQIRKLYPGDYNDLTDEKLVELWLKKYPDDKDKIEFNNKNQNKNSFSNILIVIVLIVAGVFVYNKFFSDSNININQSENSNSTTNPTSNTQNTSPQYDNGTIVSDSINSIVDSVFSIYNLSSDDIHTIKVILSDNNLDPENKEGVQCGTQTESCKWCGRSFNAPTVYQTSKSFFEYFTSPLTGGTVSSSLLSSFGVDKLKMAFHAICNEYKKGNKYHCGEDPFHTSDFCSEKCKSEYEDYKKYH